MNKRKNSKLQKNGVLVIIKYSFLYWFLFVNILINNFLENFAILFYQEKIQYIIFISLFYFPALIFSTTGYYFKFLENKFIPIFIFISSVIFWQYRNMSELIFNFFNQTNNSGVFGVIVFYFLASVISFRLKDKFSLVNFLIILSIVQIISFVTPYIRDISQSNERTNFIDGDYIEFVKKPDVYFFLFDAMAPKRVLKDYYKNDNKFIDKPNFNDSNLKEYDNIFSSYGGTSGQIKSIFNIEYFDSSKSIVSMDTNMYDNNTNLENYFKYSGYEIIKSGVVFNCKEDADTTCIKSDFVVNPIVRQLVIQTPINILYEKNIIPESFLSSNFGKYLFRNTCGFLFNASQCETLSLVNSLEGRFEDRPKLYLIHLMLTHEPFVVNSNCEFYESIDEGFSFDAYKDSIECAYKLIDEIDSKLGEENIITIQSDHGPNIEPRIRTNLSQLNDNYLSYYYPIVSFSNINKFCNEKIDSFGGTTTFMTVINCLTEKIIFNESKKYFFMEEKNQMYNFIDISDYEIFTNS